MVKFLSTTWTFEKGGRWKIGDGRTVSVRTDMWLPMGCPVNYREDILSDVGVVFVSDLINGSHWNNNLIEFAFCPSTAKQILAIPLPMHGGPDSLYWPSSLDSVYTTKLGYNFIMNFAAGHSVSSSSSGTLLSTSLWTKF